MNPQRILIADDEIEVARGASAWLNAAGFNTVTATDGRQAIERAKEEQPAAIILDVRMPQMNGLEVLDEIKSGELTKQIPVIMLSASLIDLHTALEAGARFFLKKPYQGKELIRAVQSVVKVCV